MKYHLEPYEDENFAVPKNFEEQSHNAILFAMVWSLGAILEEQVRDRFHQFLLKIVRKENISEYISLDIEIDIEAFNFQIKLNSLIEQSLFSVFFQKNEK